MSGPPQPPPSSSSSSTDPTSPPLHETVPASPEEVHFIVTTGSTNYFLPSLPDTDASTFDPTTTNFGLIHQTYPSDSTLATDNENPPTDWQRFAHHLSTLNTGSPPHISHHILFLSRHGQGYHNLAESFYGADAWDCHYAALDGDPDPSSSIRWEDAALSRLGQRQARLQHRFWKDQVERERMPRPHTYWSSPLDRACRTAAITHGIHIDTDTSDSGTDSSTSNGNSNDNDNVTITIKELLRETNGIHTCDRRRTRSNIITRFPPPSFVIEPGFREHDVLWDPIRRESDDAHTYRTRLLLDDILNTSNVSNTSNVPNARSGPGEYISVTAHGGTISAILRAVGHRAFGVRVGSAVAVYVRAERVPGRRPLVEFPPGKTAPKCVGDPLRAGLPGYKSLKEYIESVEAGVEE